MSRAESSLFAFDILVQRTTRTCFAGPALPMYIHHVLGAVFSEGDNIVILGGLKTDGVSARQVCCFPLHRERKADPLRTPSTNVIIRA